MMISPYQDEPAKANPQAPDADRRVSLDTAAASLTAELQCFRADPPEHQDEPGSVPLPEEWKLLRAVYGGASRWALEGAYDGKETRPRDVEESIGASGLVDRAAEGGRLSRGLHVVAGHTGGGKTALACNLARVAAKAGHPVVYLSLELDRAELAARVIGLEGPVSWAKIANRRRLTTEERDRKLAAIERLEDAVGRLYVWAPDPGPGEQEPTVEALRAFVLDAWERHGGRTPLVVMDYLQAPGMYGRNPEEERWRPLRERIGAITMQLRHLSKASRSLPPEWVGGPVLVLSTTARSNTKGLGAIEGMDGDNPDRIRRASIEDLKALPKEAGEIEATAVTSWALAVSRDAYAGERRLTLRLAKARQLPDGQWIPMRFSGSTGEMEDDTDRYVAARLEDEEERRKRQEKGKRWGGQVDTAAAPATREQRGLSKVLAG